MTLELFKYDTCPYCRRVMDYIASAGRKDILYQDIHKNPEEAERLVRAGRLEMEYREGEWLNLYCRDDGFFRLYYYLLSGDNYQAGADGILIADLFYREGNRPDPAKEAVKMQGMSCGPDGCYIG